MQTKYVRTEDAERNWWIIDASGLTLGRMATQVADILRGKNKPSFTPSADVGDFVIVLNSDKIKVTGDKLNSKKYYRHSRFFGSLKEKSRAEKMTEDSTFVITEAVRGMLPTNRSLSRDVLGKLKVYTGTDHPHAAQKPQTMTLKY
ncbi:MAG: 50S ribosomal protein L13 [Pseudobdellovibrionaceae bacterium]